MAIERNSGSILIFFRISLSRTRKSHISSECTTIPDADEKFSQKDDVKQSFYNHIWFLLLNNRKYAFLGNAQNVRDSP